MNRTRILDPIERFSEIVFGLIMVLTFTGALSVAEAGRGDIRIMLVGAIGCNLAWGIIDAAFYLINCLAERGRNATILRSVQAAGPAHAQRIIAEALSEPVAAALQPADLERVRDHLSRLPAPAAKPRLTAENWLGAGGVFLLVFLSTFPVVVPFLFMQDIRLALRVSNGLAIAMLFGAGCMLAGYAGMRRIRTGLAMVGIGAALVAIAIALGG
ncbi:MAG: VIT1/CCC1 transporter family protein [Terrimicrobiaceae bacterium]|nr:VIT1/CCC1 transporter family protein [Terrimicrobiaceae bacterium]